LGAGKDTKEGVTKGEGRELSKGENGDEKPEPTTLMSVPWVELGWKYGLWTCGSRKGEFQRDFRGRQNAKENPEAGRILGRRKRNGRRKVQGTEFTKGGKWLQKEVGGRAPLPHAKRKGVGTAQIKKAPWKWMRLAIGGSVGRKEDARLRLIQERKKIRAPWTNLKAGKKSSRDGTMPRKGDGREESKIALR